jgi:uncharacterized membrane protein HdeD (DUF308 family)
MNRTPLSMLGRIWWVPLVFGVISLLLGIYLVTQPLQAMVALSLAFGVLALAEGFASVIALFDSKASLPKAWLALYALASIGFGLLAITNPAFVAGFLMLLLAGWLVVAGVFRLLFAIRVRKEIEGEWLIGLSGVLSIALGLLFVANLVAALVVAGVWIGVILLLAGVLQIAAGWRLRKLRPA